MKKGMTAEMIEVPISKITAKKDWNARRLFNEKSMLELADSIRANGVIEPLIVRPAGEKYHLIAGERRLRAAKLAGLKTVPVVVRDLEDQMAFEQTISENLNRADLHPIEEADAFERLRETYGMSPGDIARVTGKSPQYVANRLQLVILSPGVRESALRTPDLQTGYLQLVAQIADHSLQDEMLRRILRPPYARGMLPMEDAKDLLANYQVPISSAQFKTSDPDLYPEAGACAACPYNTTNMPRSVFPKKEICTNTVCFAEKQRRAFVALAEEKAASIISQKEAKRIFSEHSPDRLAYRCGYVDLDAHRWDPNTGQQKTWRKWLSMDGGEHMPKLHAAMNPNGNRIFFLVKEDEAERAVKEIKRKLDPEGARQSLALNSREAAERRKRKREEKATALAVEEATAAVLMRFQEAPDSRQSAFFMLECLRGIQFDDAFTAAAKRRGIELTDAEKKKPRYEHRDVYAKKLFVLAEQMTEQEILLLIAEILLIRDRYTYASGGSAKGDASKVFKSACLRFDIDVAALRKKKIGDLRVAERQKKGKKHKPADEEESDVE